MNKRFNVIEEQVEYLFGDGSISDMGCYQEEYDEFIMFINDNAKILEEGFTGDVIERVKGGISEKLKLATDFAKAFGVKLKDMILVFKNKVFFTMMASVKWDFKKLWKMLKTAKKHTLGITQVIAEFVYEKGLKDTKVEKWGIKVLQELDEFLSQHPTLKRIGGVALGFTIIEIWFSMTFVGDPFYDFNMESVLRALHGTIGWADVFSGAEGLRLLALFVTGKVLNIPKVFSMIPWDSSNIVFIGAILATFLLMMGRHESVKRMMKHFNAKSFSQMARRHEKMELDFA